MTIDLRLVLLIGCCALLLLTIEVAEDALEEHWPRVRPVNGWAQSRSVRGLWDWLGLLVFPGLVLLILNLAELLLVRSGQSPSQILGGLFVLAGWSMYILALTRVAGLTRYFEESGPVLPIAAGALLLVGDLLLLVSGLGLLPDALAHLPH